MHPEVLDHFVKHLDAIGDVPKISLLLYTRGGSTLAAWSIVNLVRQFCDQFEVIVPFKAHSAGTLVCLGADSILMTKQATLGPVDPIDLCIINRQFSAMAVALDHETTWEPAGTRAAATASHHTPGRWGVDQRGSTASGLFT
jgi:membrane-bound ClpP family serine protease